jgi:hypothetical protein
MSEPAVESVRSRQTIVGRIGLRNATAEVAESDGSVDVVTSGLP